CIDSLQLVNDAELRRLLVLDDGAEAVLPLAPMQRDFCLDSVREPDTQRNSIGAWLALPFAVDAEQWRQALQAVVAANPFLRARFVESSRTWLEPFYQVIARNAPAQLGLLDWRDRALPEIELQQALESLALPAWTVLGGPLTRHYLVRVSDQKHIAVVASHHAVFDGVSKRQYFHQMLDAYAGNSLEAMPVSLLQQWIQQRSDSTDSRAVIDYWRDALSQSEPLGNRAAQPGAAVVDRWELAADEHALLQSWCRNRGVSVTNYLRTLYALAIRQTDYRDERIVLIDAMAGRDSATGDGDLENAVGCFFQFLPSVQQTGPGIDSIGDLLQANRQWRKRMGDACFLSMLERRQFLNPNALEFQFNYRLPAVTDAFEYQGASLHIEPVQPDNAGTVKLLVTPRNESLHLRLSFRANDFAGFDLLKRMRQVHGQIMAGEENLAQLDWLFAAEKQQQLQQWQGLPVADYSGETLLDLLARQVDATPDAVAVICGSQQQNYRALDAASNRVAHWLNRQGIGRGQRVAVCLGRGLWLPSLYLGVVKSGAAYVPMDAAYPADRIAYIVEDSQAPVLVTENCVLKRLQEAGVVLPTRTQILLADDIDTLLQDCPDQPLPKLPQPDDILYYVYTSGSTGRPKGAGVYHRGERNLLQWYRQLLQLNGQSRVLLLSALGFDLTQKNLFIPFCTGAALVIPDFEDYDPEQLGHLIAQQNVSVINCAPSAFYPLVEQDSHPGYPFASLRHVVLGGEPIRLGSLKHWFDAPAVNCTLTNSYGPTECTDVVAYCSLQQIDDIHRAMPIGRALPNTQLFIVNQQGALMPTGATGELCVAGIGVGTGYLNRPELNEQSFQPARFGTGAANWYRTGDLVRYNDAGELVYVGRKDFQVKLRGLRIEPGEIDSILKTLAHVRDALTLVVDDRLVSYVIAPRSFDIPAGRDALRKQLPEFMVPGAIVLLDAWPLTPNGKIDRKALPKPDARDQGAHVPPRNDSEQRIADIWCQVLKLSQVSVTANFFEVGGHSLLATQVVSRIRQAFGVELSVRTLFESPTIEKLTHAISSAAAAGFVDTAPPIVPLDPPNRDTLSFAQYRLWFVDQLNQGSSEYNLPSALKITGPLDVAVLDRV
ncbi:MAG TPA: amino acid adenylation domain-containing protein, partial [Candidatus Kapabacteria bacterium]|nr:amino acid adenylation domain-containing protein [Candidatus Kapabacteria bacterium]